jgi:hypothetical protein
LRKGHKSAHRLLAHNFGECILGIWQGIRSRTFGTDRAKASFKLAGATLKLAETVFIRLGIQPTGRALAALTSIGETFNV